MLKSKSHLVLIYLLTLFLNLCGGIALADCFPINLTVAGPPPIGFQFPGVALDANSNAIAVFTDGNTDTLFSSSISSPYTAWSTPPSNITPVPPVALTLFGSPPAIAIDALGNKTAAWPMGDGTNFFFQAERQAVNSLSWPSNAPITSPILASMNDLFLPSISGDQQGNIIAAWLDSSSAPAATFQATVLPAGATSWSSFQSLASDSTNALHFGPQTSVNNGNAIVVWAVYDTSPLQIQAQRYHFSTDTWSSTFSLTLPADIADVLQLSVAIDLNGNTIAAMIVDNGTSSQTLTAVLPISTSIWTIPEYVSNPVNFVQTSPSILSTSIDASGRATVVWPEGTTLASPVDVNAASVDLSGTPSTATVISSASSSQIISIQVVSDSRGNVLAAWGTAESSGAFTAQQATKEIGQSWSAACQLSGTGLTPFPALNDQETAVIVWQDSNTGEIISAIFPGIFPLPTPPLPPKKFVGKIFKNAFFDRIEYILATTWKPSPSPDVVAYFIFKNEIFLASVPATPPFIFETKVAGREIEDIYSIKAVDNNDLLSTPVLLRVIPDDD